MFCCWSDRLPNLKIINELCIKSCLNSFSPSSLNDEDIIRVISRDEMIVCKKWKLRQFIPWHISSERRKKQEWLRCFNSCFRAHKLIIVQEFPSQDVEAELVINHKFSTFTSLHFTFLKRAQHYHHTYYIIVGSGKIIHHQKDEFGYYPWMERKNGKKEEDINII